MSIVCIACFCIVAHVSHSFIAFLKNFRVLSASSKSFWSKQCTLIFGAMLESLLNLSIFVQFEHWQLGLFFLSQNWFLGHFNAASLICTNDKLGRDPSSWSSISSILSSSRSLECNVTYFSRWQFLNKSLARSGWTNLRSMQFNLLHLVWKTQGWPS